MNLISACPGVLRGWALVVGRKEQNKPGDWQKRASQPEKRLENLSSDDYRSGARSQRARSQEDQEPEPGVLECWSVGGMTSRVIEHTFMVGEFM